MVSPKQIRIEDSLQVSSASFTSSTIRLAMCLTTISNKVTADLKPIYKATTEEMALVVLDRFEEAWGAKYPLIVRSWRSNWDELATFFKYPNEIQSDLYDEHDRAIVSYAR